MKHWIQGLAGGVSVLSAAALVAGCGSSGGATASGAGPGSGTQSATTGACDSGNPVNVGVIDTLSGAAATVGQSALDGVKAAVTSINGHGGILGRCMKLTIKDDGGEPTQASSAARELSGQDHVSAVIGPLLSSNTDAVLPVLTSAKVIDASIGSPPDALDPKSSPYTYIFGTSGPAGASAFATCATNSGLTKIAVLAVNNALGTDYLDALKESLKGTSARLVASQFENEGTVDVTSQLRKLKETDPDVLMLFNTGADIIAALKGRAALNWNVPVVGFTTIADSAVSSAVGADGMNGVYGSGFAPALTRASASDSLPSTPAGAAFIKQLQTYYKQNPLQVSAAQRAPAYDATQFVATVFNKAGTLDADAARSYADAHGFVGVQGRYIFSSSTHAGVAGKDLVCIDATSLKNGTYVTAPKLG